jgi:hypothetical protein
MEWLDNLKFQLQHIASQNMLGDDGENNEGTAVNELVQGTRKGQVGMNDERTFYQHTMQLL